MSYILDALRKADAERERGAVPGLHAQPASAEPQDKAASGLNHALLWAVGVLSVLVVGLLAWTMSGHEPPRDHTPPGPQAVGMPPRDQGHMALPGGPPPSTNAYQAVRPTEALTQAPVGTYPPAQSSVVPVPQAVIQAKDKPGSDKTETSAALSAKPSAANPATQSAVASGDNRVYQFSELPESVRHELPNLTVGGAMYSDTPASRMLIINSQVFHEGDKLNAELTLEEIRLKSAVLRFRTYRYAINY